MLPHLIRRDVEWVSAIIGNQVFRVDGGGGLQGRINVAMFRLPGQILRVIERIGGQKVFKRFVVVGGLETLRPPG